MLSDFRQRSARPFRYSGTLGWIDDVLRIKDLTLDRFSPRQLVHHDAGGDSGVETPNRSELRDGHGGEALASERRTKASTFVTHDDCHPVGKGEVG